TGGSPIWSAPRAVDGVQEHHEPGRGTSHERARGSGQASLCRNVEYERTGYGRVVLSLHVLMGARGPGPVGPRQDHALLTVLYSSNRHCASIHPRFWSSIERVIGATVSPVCVVATGSNSASQHSSRATGLCRTPFGTTYMSPAPSVTDS